MSTSILFGIYMAYNGCADGTAEVGGGNFRMCEFKKLDNKTVKQIAVLLTVFNRCEKTVECLEQFNRVKIPEGYAFDVWITDDGCTDGTVEAVVKIMPDVHIIKGNGNLYWNRGMCTAWNAAAKAKDYDYYFWLNDDTVVYTHVLCVLLMAAEKTDNKANIVGATLSCDNSRQTYGGRNKKKCLIKPNGELCHVDFFNGNIVLVPREIFKRLGTMDPIFHHSFGDFDYGLRAIKAEFENYQVGNYLGECDCHSTLNAWCNPKVTLKKRWRAMHRPNGMPPREMFIFEQRHRGLLVAVFHYFTIHLRCLFPWFW